MEQKRHVLQGKNVLKVSIPLILLVVGVSIVGLFYPSIYKAETTNWLTQSTGQDAVDLFLIVPVLIIGTAYSFASSRTAVYLWLGTLLYLVYTFLIYCFTVRFNPLFIPYCMTLGISFFSVVWFFSGDKKQLYASTRNKILGVIGVYFIAISVLFYSFWLAEIIPATIKNEIPVGIIDAGLITNPVHVIDLSLLLPATFIVGILTLRRTASSTIFSPILLIFFILMDITIAGLSVIMKIRDVGGSYTIASVMIALAAFSAVLFVRYTQSESGAGK